MSRIPSQPTGSIHPPADTAAPYAAPPSGSAVSPARADLAGTVERSVVVKTPSAGDATVLEPAPPRGASDAGKVEQATLLRAADSTTHSAASASGDAPIQILEPPAAVAAVPTTTATADEAAAALATSGSDPRQPGRIPLDGDMKEISELPKPVPVPIAATPPAVAAANSQPPASTAADLQPPVSTAAADAGPASRYGFSADYAQLRGKLEHTASTGKWKLRYIPIDGRTDQYGGSVELAGALALTASYKDGDFVQVAGQLGSASSDEHGFAPLYRISSVRSLP
jgi:hypothetical protein